MIENFEIHNINDNIEKYKKEFFTEYGYKSILGLTKTYVGLLLEGNYPVRTGMVFDFPFYRPNSVIKNKDELLGRIKVMMAMLGLQQLQLSNGQIFSLEEKDGE